LNITTETCYEDLDIILCSHPSYVKVHCKVLRARMVIYYMLAQ